MLIRFSRSGAMSTSSSGAPVEDHCSTACLHETLPVHHNKEETYEPDLHRRHSSVAWTVRGCEPRLRPSTSQGRSGRAGIDRAELWPLQTNA